MVVATMLKVDMVTTRTAGTMTPATRTTTMANLTMTKEMASKGDGAAAIRRKIRKRSVILL